MLISKVIARKHPTLVIAWVFIALSAAISGFVLSNGLLRPLFTEDLWQHLKLGEMIVQQQELPQQELLLFTSDPDQPPIYHEWLFQVSVFACSEAVGLYGMRVVHFFLGCLALFTMAFWLRESGMSRAAASVILILTCVFAFQRLFQFRPHLVSIMLFFLLLGLVFRHLEHASVGFVWLSGCIGLIWANMHSLAPIIFPFWFFTLLIAIALKKVTKFGSELDVKGQVAALTGCFVGMLINPLGPKFFAFFFIHDANNDLKKVVDEWGHFNPLVPGVYYPQTSWVVRALFLLMAGLALILTIKQMRLIVKSIHTENSCDEQPRPHLAILAGLSLLSLAVMVFAARFLWLAPIPMAFIALHLVSLRWRWAALGGSVCLAASSYAHQQILSQTGFLFPLDTGFRRQYFLHWSYDRIKFHAPAMEFLKMTQIHGNLYNPYSLGGFLGYHLAPESRCFVDGRFDRYSSVVDADHNHIRMVTRDFRALLEKYPIDILFLPLDGEHFRLHVALKRLAWPVIYHDFQTILYARPQRISEIDMARISAYAGKQHGIDRRFQNPSSWVAHQMRSLRESMGGELLQDPSRIDIASPESWRHTIRFLLRHHLHEEAGTWLRRAQQHGVLLPDLWRQFNLDMTAIRDVSRKLEYEPSLPSAPHFP